MIHLVECLVVITILYHKTSNLRVSLRNGLLLVAILYYLDKSKSQISGAIRNYVGYYTINTIFSV